MFHVIMDVPGIEEYLGDYDSDELDYGFRNRLAEWIIGNILGRDEEILYEEFAENFPCESSDYISGEYECMLQIVDMLDISLYKKYMYDIRRCLALSKQNNIMVYTDVQAIGVDLMTLRIAGVS